MVDATTRNQTQRNIFQSQKNNSMIEKDISLFGKKLESKRIKKKLLDLKKPLILDQSRTNRPIVNMSNQSLYCFSARDYLYFSPTSRTVIKTGIMERIQKDKKNKKIKDYRTINFAKEKQKNDIETYKYILSMKPRNKAY